MLTVLTSAQFEKDYRTIIKSGTRDLKKIKTVMHMLVMGIPLDPKYKDHKLIGNYKGRRECHISPDWLLIYKHIDSDKILFERTGSHSELFKK